MHDGIVAAIVFTEFVDLCMAIVAPCNAVIRFSGFDLVVFDLSVQETVTLKSGLKESAAAAAAEVV